MSYTHESGCSRCVFFAVEHNGGVFGWAKVLALFAWHRTFGKCKPMSEVHDSLVCRLRSPLPQRQTR